MRYTISFSKKYRDAFIGVNAITKTDRTGKIYEFNESITHRIENVQETDLASILTQLLEKGYGKVSVTEQRY